MSFAIVQAPSGLGLRAPGVEGLGDALLGHGLAKALQARTATTVTPPRATGEVDPASGVLNGPEIAEYAVALADAVGAVLDAGDVPLVLGGDCSVLLGGALGSVTRRSRPATGVSRFPKRSSRSTSPRSAPPARPPRPNAPSRI